MTTRTNDLMEAIHRRFNSGALRVGERLPSIRSFAASMKVAPSTVVEAYDRLAAEGYIRSRPGSGFYVIRAAAQPPLFDLVPVADRAIDPLWVSRLSLDADATTLKPGCGWLPPDWMPTTAIRRSIRRLTSAEDSILTAYSNTRGSQELRNLLARRFSQEGLDIGPGQILLTGSGTQAIDLICRLLLKPGDTVLVDDPCYFNFQALLHVHRVKIVGVPYTPTGPDLALFVEALSTHRPRLYLTNSALHNPTGATMTPSAAHRILKAAASHDLTIVEDDIFSDFEPEPSARLAVLDGLSQVIRIGSFSKTLSASFRCGYIAARSEWIEALTDLQVATNFGGTSPLTTQIIAHTLGDGSYQRHLERLRQRLTRSRHEVQGTLGACGIFPWVEPRGGFYLWCRLPEGRDASEVARAAFSEGIVLAPGNVFSVSHAAQEYLRFNVAHMGDPRVYGFLSRALGHPSPCKTLAR